MRGRVILGIALVLAGLASAPARAQIIVSPTASAEVYGVVTALNGSTILPGVLVECVDDAGQVIASTISGAEGRFRLAGLPAGTWHLTATLDGFQTLARTITLGPGQILERALDMALASHTETVEVVESGGMATLMSNTLSPRDGLAPATLDRAPLPGGSIQSALPMLAGVVQGREGLSIRGGFPTQSSVEWDGSGAIEPSTGQTVAWLPADAVAAVDILPNPYAAEYGHFSSGVTTFQTRQGGNAWRTMIQDFDPTLRRQRDGFGIIGVEAVSPRVFLGGPLIRDRLFFAQSIFYRYNSVDIRSRPQGERLNEHTASTFSRVDANLGNGQNLTATVGVFPQRIDSFNFDTFNPPGVAANWRQQAVVAGVSHAYPLASSVLQGAFHFSRYHLGVEADGVSDMVITPELNTGNYYNTQDRFSRAWQWQESFSGQRRGDWGQHLFKGGLELQHAGYEGASTSRPVRVLREDGTLAQTIVFGGPSSQQMSATDVSVFAQDRWQPAPRMLIELGMRLERDGVLEQTNLSPRVGALLALKPDGSITIRGGIGLFYERTPLAAGAFEESESRTITRYPAAGVLGLARPVTYVPRADAVLRTAHSRVWNAEYEQKVTRRLTLRGNYLDRDGVDALVEGPTGVIDETGHADLLLSSTGRSTYREAGLSVNYVSGDDSEVSVSYLRSSSQANLNAYSVAAGVLPDPLVRPDAFGPMNTDVPNRLVARAFGGVGRRIRLFGTLELRDGLPYSTVDGQQDFVGPRNEGHRFPFVARTDLAVEYGFTYRGWHPWIGVRFWNALNTFLPQDVQRNVTSPGFGSFYNQLPRVIRFTFRLQH